MSMLLKGIKEISVFVLIAILLLSLLVSYVLLNGPLTAFLEARFSQYALTIEVRPEVNDNAIPNREVWINRLRLGGEEDMQAMFDRSEGHGFEYREAAEYGYSSDVITNVGGEGSSITFRWDGGEDDSVEFWQQALSGIVKVTLRRGDTVLDENTIDLYSAEDGGTYYTYFPDSSEQQAPVNYNALRYGGILAGAAVLSGAVTVLLARVIVRDDEKNKGKSEPDKGEPA